MVFAQERFRNGTRVTQSRNSSGCSGTLGSLLINHDTDDFDIGHYVELLEHLLAIGHLWNSFGRHKTDSIDMLKARSDQRTKVTRLKAGWDLSLEPLPGVTWTLDQF